ncbi:MAG: hypothetical protein IPF68_03600 [Bacteroidales bacterium]|nr:hypothetical protein [Bacteroidales bacterium]
MNQRLSVFTKQLLILATLTGLFITGAIFLIPPDYISPTLPFLLVFFTASTLLSFYFLEKKLKASASRFVTAFMANSMIRLMLYLAVIVVYALANRPDSVNFIISFLSFTLFSQHLKSLSFLGRKLNKLFFKSGKWLYSLLENYKVALRIDFSDCARMIISISSRYLFSLNQHQLIFRSINRIGYAKF